MTQSNAVQTRPAAIALRPFVSALALREAVSDGIVSLHLPELRPSIQIVVGDPYWLKGHRPEAEWMKAPRTGFWGPRTAREYGYAEGRIRIFGIGLTPTGARHILGGPPGSAADTVIPLETFAPAFARKLETAASADFSEWCAAAEQALAGAFEGATAAEALPDAALAVLATGEGGAVAQAAQACGLSERHFRRVFRDAYGVTPKTYQRFQRVDRMLRSLHPRPWEIDPYKDESSGYADQPHAIREFRALTGMTPNAYAKAKALDRESVLRSVHAPDIAPPCKQLACQLD